MLRNLNLYIDTGKKPVEIPVHIDKITDAKTTLNTVYQGRRVRTATILTKGDVEKVTSVDDIEAVVDRSQTTSGLEVQAPDGSTTLVTLDKASLTAGASTSRNLTVIAVVPSRTIKPYQYEGSSYEVSIHGKTVKKVKVVEPQHTQIFNILYHGLNSRDEIMIAKYTSFGREKFATIYPVECNPITGNQQNTLIMSNLIPSSYYRTFTSQQVSTEDAINNGLGASLTPDTLAALYAAHGHAPPKPGSVTEEGAPKVPPIVVQFFYDKIVKTVRRDLRREDYFDHHELQLKKIVSDLTSRVIKGEPVPGSDELVEEVAPPPAVVVPEHLQMLIDL